MSNDGVEAKLEILIKLQAYLAVAPLESQIQKILFLTRLGLSTRIISEILDTTPNTVSVAISKAKKSGRLKPERTAQEMGNVD